MGVRRPPTRWTLDNRYLETVGWSYVDVAEGGNEVATVQVSDAAMRRMRTLPEVGQVLEAGRDLDVPYLGELTDDPTFDEASGLWTLSARGPMRDAEDHEQALLYQTRDVGLWKKADAEPHNYSHDDGFEVDTSRPGVIVLSVPRGEPHGEDDRAKVLLWVPQSLVTQVQATRDANRGSSLHELLIRRGTGPDGAMSTDGAVLAVDGGSIDRTLAVASDQVEFDLNVKDSEYELASNYSQTANEDETLRSSAAQGAGTTNTGGGVSIAEGTEEVVITIDVSASSGAGRSLDVDIQTSHDGGESWRTVGSRTVTANGTTQVTVSDRLGTLLRYRGTTNSTGSFTYSVKGRKIPAGIFNTGGASDLPGEPVSAELTLTVDSISGTGKSLEVEVQTANANQRGWRTIGSFRPFDSADSQKIEVENVGDRLRLKMKIYGSSSPAFQLDCTSKLGYRRLRVSLREPRANGRIQGDSATVAEILEDVAGIFGWSTSGVSAALTLNALPLYWQEAAAELLSYLTTGLVDGHWGVYGRARQLRAALWSEARTWYAWRGWSTFPEVKRLQPYDDVIVRWRTRNDVWHQRPRTTSASARYLEVVLADVQTNDDLAELVRQELLADALELRYHGRAPVYAIAPTAGGPWLPPDLLLPGDLLRVPNFAELRSETMRVTEVARSSAGPVLAGLDDSTSHVRWENRARLVRERRAGRKPRR